MRRFFKPTTSGIASIILILATAISYICGLLRDILIGNYFGAGAITDAYNTAFLVPDLIYTITIAGSLSGAFLPIFRSEYNKNKQSAWQLASSFFITSQFLVIGLSIAAYIFMPSLASLFETQTPEQKDLIISLSRWLLLSPIVFSISNFLGAILNSFKHYLAYALSASFYNVGIIAGITLWHDTHGIYSAVYGVAIGLALHLAIRIFDLTVITTKEPRENFSLKINKLFTPALKKIYLLGIPKTFGLLAWQLSLWTYNLIGYQLITGSIAAFNYGRNIQSFAVSVFGISIATAVFPFLVDHRDKEENADFQDRLRSTSLQIWFYTWPSALGLAILAPEFIDLLLGRGQFDQAAIALTSGVLSFLALAIPFESLTHLYARAFYSYNAIVTPVSVSFLFLSINIGLSYFLSPIFGVTAFGIGFLIASLIQIIILAIFFHKKFLPLANNSFAPFAKILVGGLLMGALTYYLKIIYISNHISLIITITISSILYFVFNYYTKTLGFSGLRKLQKWLPTSKN